MNPQVRSKVPSDGFLATAIDSLVDSGSSLVLSVSGYRITEPQLIESREIRFERTTVYRNGWPSREILRATRPYLAQAKWLTVVSGSPWLEEIREANRELYPESNTPLGHLHWIVAAEDTTFECLTPSPIVYSGETIDF